MAVGLYEFMKIYTKTGDLGETGLFGGKRVPKNYVRIEACGSVDEANAFIGLAMNAIQQAVYKNELSHIQRKLFDVGTSLANPEPHVPHITEKDVRALEKAIDTMTAVLPNLRAFILPGGTEAATRLQVARACVRRAERRAVSVGQLQDVPVIVLQYLNRLSDYLFTLARMINVEAGIPDVEWHQDT